MSNIVEMEDRDIASMTMEQIGPRLCAKSKGDACSCIDCEPKCPYGVRAVELLENETKTDVRFLTRKQISDMSKKAEAMRTYIGALRANDPIEFLKQKYSSDDGRKMQMKIYQWRHAYGSNMLQISVELQDIEKQISSSIAKMKNESSERTDELRGVKTVANSPETRTMRREEEKISRNYLEQTRRELEETILSSEKEIEDHHKSIKECEKRIEDATNKIQAIRQILEIFKERDKIYA